MGRGVVSHHRTSHKDPVWTHLLFYLLQTTPTNDEAVQHLRGRRCVYGVHSSCYQRRIVRSLVGLQNTCSDLGEPFHYCCLNPPITSEMSRDRLFVLLI